MENKTIIEQNIDALVKQADELESQLLTSLVPAKQSVIVSAQLNQTIQAIGILIGIREEQKKKNSCIVPIS